MNPRLSRSFALLVMALLGSSGSAEARVADHAFGAVAAHTAYVFPSYTLRRV